MPRQACVQRNTALGLTPRLAQALMSGGASSKYAKLEAAAVEANDDFIEDQGQKQEVQLSRSMQIFVDDNSSSGRD